MTKKENIGRTPRNDGIGHRSRLRHCEEVKAQALTDVTIWGEGYVSGWVRFVEIPTAICQPFLANSLGMT